MWCRRETNSVGLLGRGRQQRLLAEEQTTSSHWWFWFSLETNFKAIMFSTITIFASIYEAACAILHNVNRKWSSACFIKVDKHVAWKGVVRYVWCDDEYVDFIHRAFFNVRLGCDRYCKPRKIKWVFAKGRTRFFFSLFSRIRFDCVLHCHWGSNIDPRVVTTAPMIITSEKVDSWWKRSWSRSCVRLRYFF